MSAGARGLTVQLSYEAVRHCDYGIEYLSCLARTGRLGAVMIRSRWMTTREAMERYGEKINGKGMEG